MKIIALPLLAWQVLFALLLILNRKGLQKQRSEEKYKTLSKLCFQGVAPWCSGQHSYLLT